MARLLAIASLALVLGGCLDEPLERADATARRPKVVLGVDDRMDVYAHPDGALAAQARDSVVALVNRQRLRWDGVRFEVVGVSNLDERQNLCDDERFADQPTVASCSGTLVDDDLVLTAGHCILPQGPYGTAGCTTTRFVFDFLQIAEGTLASIDLDDVYDCRAVVAHWLDDEVDYALVQLDRPVVGRIPAAVRRVGGPLPIGDPMIEIGFPTGMPMKIDAGGRVLDPGPPGLPYFVTSLDAFRGNSGSGVLDASRSVVGIVARTSQADYVYDARARCYRVNVEPEHRGSLAVSYVDTALVDLCDESGYPSARLCGIAPACGDAFCTAGESASCPGDCAGPVCGDGICAPTDDAASCPYDCGATVAYAAPGGCSLAPAGSVGASAQAGVALVLLGLLARARRGRHRLRAWLAALLLASAAGSAAAQPHAPSIHPWGLRFVAGAEVRRDGATLHDPNYRFGTLHETGLGYGLALGADVGLGRWAGLQGIVSGHRVGGLESFSVDLALAPRLRLLMRPRHELYLRVPVGFAWQIDAYGGVVGGPLVGAGVGYRWQLTRVVDAFVELDLQGRFGGAVDPYYAYAQGYDLHPSSPPHLRTLGLGLRLGVGLGRGVRTRCHAP